MRYILCDVDNNCVLLKLLFCDENYNNSDMFQAITIKQKNLLI